MLGVNCGEKIWNWWNNRAVLSYPGVQQPVYQEAEMEGIRRGSHVRYFADFHQWVVRITDKVMDRNGIKITWIVSALIWTTRFVSDARYRVGDRTPVEDKWLRPCENHVVFKQALSPYSPLDFDNHKNTPCKALRTFLSARCSMQTMVRAINFQSSTC